jgi:hypothetical protein
MRSRLAALSVGLLLALAMIVGPASANVQAPNQGDPDKVITVNNQNVQCQNPQPQQKREGDFGRTINVRANHPIDFVTVKSGQGAFVVSKSFDTFQGQITLSKDVSNFVVWVCKQQNQN